MFYSNEEIYELGFSNKDEFIIDFTSRHKNCCIMCRSDGVYLNYDMDSECGWSNDGCCLDGNNKDNEIINNDELPNEQCEPNDNIIAKEYIKYYNLYAEYIKHYNLYANVLFSKDSKIKPIRRNEKDEEFEEDEELKLEKINNALKELHYYKYCDKEKDEECEHCHCIYSELWIGSVFKAICGRRDK